MWRNGHGEVERGANPYISTSSSFHLHFEPSPSELFFLLNTNNNNNNTTTNNSHTAPIWQISWAHPSFGSILASCSYDSRVFVWKETSSSSTTTNNSTSRGMGLGGGLGKGAAGGSGAGEWEKIKEVGAHSASGESTRSVLVFRCVVCSAFFYLQPQVQENNNKMTSTIPEIKKRIFLRDRDSCRDDRICNPRSNES